jgi:hypothetical protein
MEDDIDSMRQQISGADRRDLLWVRRRNWGFEFHIFMLIMLLWC